MGKAILAMLVLAVALGSCGAKSSYNSMVSQGEAVDRSWAQVENVYQRRLDLIPNLVSVVKAYAGHENETFVAVTEARAQASSVQVDPSNLTAASLGQFSASQSALSSALGRLMVVVEAYPELKANQNFLELQAQLEGTENRIAVERGKFNEAVEAYNRTVRQFPGVVYARMFGFSSRPYFEADDEAAKAPTVEL